MTPLTVVTWRWAPKPGYRSVFGPETVNTLRRMVKRHYPHPHVFKCVTDDARGIDADVEIVEAWNDFADLPSPTGGHNPSCYRRLRMFAPDIAQTFGPRFVSLDLDIVFTNDLTPLWNRSEDFVIWGDTNPRTFYNGSMVLMSAGARSQVWTTFHPVMSPRAAKTAGHHGSDQGWISHCLGPKETKWTQADGVYSFHNHLQQSRRLPSDARAVIFHGHKDPWQRRVQQQYPWITKYYH